jgi:hypothetical protein
MCVLGFPIFNPNLGKVNIDNHKKAGIKKIRRKVGIATTHNQNVVIRVQK